MVVKSNFQSNVQYRILTLLVFFLDTDKIYI